MSFSKIILDPKSKHPITVEDIALVKLRQPLYTLYRFKVYKLKILEKDFYDNENLQGYVIESAENEHERAVVFLTIVAPKKIIKFRLQRKLKMDCEQALLLMMALIVKLRETQGYEYHPFGFPKQK